MSKRYQKVIKVALELWAFFGRGRVPIEIAQTLRPFLLFIMGAHEARTAQMAARLIVSCFSETQVVISGGGAGRGSYFLQQDVADTLRAHLRTPLASEDEACESRILRRFCADLGVDSSRIHLEEKALHSRANFELSMPIFKGLGLSDDAEIGVVQSAVNRVRAQYTGEAVLREHGFPKVRVATIGFPGPDPKALSEKALVIELFRLFGSPGVDSELAVCEKFCPEAVHEMTPTLMARARTAEREFHDLLRVNSAWQEFVAPALARTAREVGGEMGEAL